MIQKKSDPAPPNAVCGVVNPTENLQWLKDRINELKTNTEFSKYLYVQQSTYDGQTVFMFGSCCPFCNSTTLVRDCSGNTLDISSREVTDPFTVIWTGENSECMFI